MQNRIDYLGRRAGEVLSFEPLPLTLDLLLAVALTIIVGSLANVRLKTRGPQFTLKEFSIVVLMVSLATGYLVDRWKTHQAQEAVLDELGTTSLFAKWQPFGPYWLREWTGHRYWSWGDLLVGVEMDHSDQLPKMPGKRSIRVLSVRTIRGESVPALDGFTNLQAIDLSRVNYDYGNVENKFQAELWHFFQGVGQCRSLEGLNLYEAKVTNQGLAQLTALRRLRHLELSGNLDIDDRGVACLKSLTSLQSPSLVRNLRYLRRNCRSEAGTTALRDRVEVKTGDPSRSRDEFPEL